MCLFTTWPHFAYTYRPGFVLISTMGRWPYWKEALGERIVQVFFFFFLYILLTTNLTLQSFVDIYLTLACIVYICSIFRSHPIPKLKYFCYNIHLLSIHMVNFLWWFKWSYFLTKFWTGFHKCYLNLSVN